MKSLEEKFSCGLSLYYLLYCCEDPLTNEDLSILGLSTEASGEIHHWTDGSVLTPAFESDHSQGRVSLSNSYAKT